MSLLCESHRRKIVDNKKIADAVLDLFLYPVRGGTEFKALCANIQKGQKKLGNVALDNRRCRVSFH